MPVRNVVFDIGGVFLDWDPDYLYRKLIPNDAERAFFLAHVTPRIWNGHQDLGLHSWADAVAARSRLYPEYADLIQAYDERWPEMVRSLIDGTVAIKAQLREAGVPLYAITNFNTEKWALSQELWPFLKDFDGIIVSGTEKILKPDPGIYRLLCQRYGLNPEECIFIDDVAANVEGAKSVGMVGHVFANPQELAQTLQNHMGLKVTP